MSKYKPLTDTITRTEAALIVDHTRFDSAVRAEKIKSVGKMGEGRTSPLLFEQSDVRDLAIDAANELADQAKDLKAQAKEIGKQEPPLTRRHIAEHIGKQLTGTLIRAGALSPDGKVTDTKTAAHTYGPKHVADVLTAVADQYVAEAKLLRAGSKARIPA